MTSCSSVVPSGLRSPARYDRTSLEDCYRRAGKIAPWFACAAAASFAVALYLVFSAAPAEAARAEHHRIAFIHGPATWMSVLIYVLTASAAALGGLMRQRLLSILASALAPTGAMFAFVSLWTGSLSGKPVWGVWWVWDAHLSSELLLLFLFLGFIALREAIDDNSRADRASGVLGLVGLVILPLLYFSVHWWSSRQGFAASDVGAVAETGPASVITMLAMCAALACYTLAAALTRLRIVILERERNSEWVSSEPLS